MRIKKADPLRTKNLYIQDKEERSSEAIGFDDMAAITFGDESKVLSSTRSSSVGIQADSFAERIAKEDKADRKNLLILLIVAIIAITSIIVVKSLIKHHQEQIDGKIQVNYSSENLKSMYFEDVIVQLKKQGFTNIKTEKDEDLILGWLTKDGEVESVSIDGATSFSSDSRFLPDAEIIILYHTFPND